MRSKRRRTAIAGAVLTLAVTGAGCSGEGSDADEGAKPAVPFRETVVVRSSGYHPKDAEVLVGGTVTWINRDPNQPHTAETDRGRYDNLPGGENQSFDTHTLSWGEPYTVTFHKPGTYAYHSSFDGFEGTVTVVAPEPPR